MKQRVIRKWTNRFIAAGKSVHRLKDPWADGNGNPFRSRLGILAQRFYAAGETREKFLAAWRTGRGMTAN
jgi:hypothetical protein